MIFKLGELFCGPGGIAMGAKTASKEFLQPGFGIEHAWATDNDPDACKTFGLNIFGDLDSANVICSDVASATLFAELAEIADVDALAFGFPCNDFSSVGKRQGTEGDFGPLYLYAIKALHEFSPKWFLAENVRGLRNTNDGMAFKQILKEMDCAGYDVVPHLYKFEQYGVPQTRHRIIIVGIRKDQGITFRVPSPEPYRSWDISSRNALTEPPIAADAKNHERTNQSQRVIERLNHISPGENAFSLNVPLDLRLNINGATISQIYKRLHPHKPAYTVTGSGGGGTHVYHWDEPRALTNRERARLQTFNDCYEFIGSKERVRRQIGMAVPPRGVKAIFDAILKAFAGLEYDHVEANITFDHGNVLVVD